MANTNQPNNPASNDSSGNSQQDQSKPAEGLSKTEQGQSGQPQREHLAEASGAPASSPEQTASSEQAGGQLEGDAGGEGRSGARGTAAMDPGTRQEVARKGGLAVSRNRQHMAEIGRKGGQRVSQNRDHMAKIGRKGGAASRGSR